MTSQRRVGSLQATRHPQVLSSISSIATLHSELLFKYCSCYSDTRGVTVFSGLWIAKAEPV
jgi:hypothetical protein